MNMRWTGLAWPQLPLHSFSAAVPAVMHARDNSRSPRPNKGDKRMRGQLAQCSCKADGEWDVRLHWTRVAGLVAMALNDDTPSKSQSLPDDESLLIVKYWRNTFSSRFSDFSSNGESWGRLYDRSYDSMHYLSIHILWLNTLLASLFLCALFAALTGKNNLFSIIRPLPSYTRSLRNTDAYESVDSKWHSE